ncbi:outer membrane beta-barrel protein [Desulfoluna butyratoxydans]|uniref:Outer membrane protein beta-barrel n=1 Tax=Desulfoluna butyratoxydans TaxID=231438 RepID=A0A4U8YPW5_9BACT|nr:outer membrane beta-barrel protein [Desulfoluna butyratoxydans]VFQ45840.1 outer membrane protein beta-barrel [Desulfoluna butyratoxydans]
MKRILFSRWIPWICLLGLCASVCTAYGDVGSIELSGGVLAPYDVSEGDTSVGWQIAYAAGVTDHVEIGAIFMKTGNFEADNDITDGEVEISTLMLQTRWLFNPESKTRGFVDLAGGMMDLDPKGKATTSSRSGGAARLGIGVDQALTPHLALRFSTGYTTGIGRTSEIDILDVSVSLVFGVRLLE